MFYNRNNSNYEPPASILAIVLIAVMTYVIVVVFFSIKTTREQRCNLVKTKDLPYVAECVNSFSPKIDEHYTNKYCKAVANKEIPHSSAFCDLCVKDALLKNECNKAMMQTIINNN